LQEYTEVAIPMIDYHSMAQLHVADLYPSIVYSKPRLMDLPPGAIIGTWAYSVPGIARFILDRTIEIVPGVLPGDLARTWIRDEYKLPFRRRKDQLEKGYSAPLHARRGKHGFCTYVDIKGAYLSILKLGYDLEYRRGKYIGADPRPVPEQIAASKFTYAIAVVMSGPLRANLQIMGHNGLHNPKPLNIYSNPCLYHLAQDTLNGIASEVLRVLGDQCVYIHTDGYIIREGFEQYAIEIIRSWGFEARIKYQGECEVKGVSSYKIGDHKTNRFDPNAHDFTNPMMDKQASQWLKTHVVLWNEDLNDGE
jgi:hypothetical protein